MRQQEYIYLLYPLLCVQGLASGFEDDEAPASTDLVIGGEIELHELPCQDESFDPVTNPLAVAVQTEPPKAEADETKE